MENPQMKENTESGRVFKKFPCRSGCGFLRCHSTFRFTLDFETLSPFIIICGFLPEKRAIPEIKNNEKYRWTVDRGCFSCQYANIFTCYQFTRR